MGHEPPLRRSGPQRANMPGMPSMCLRVRTPPAVAWGRPRHVPRFGQSKSRRKEHQHLTPKISVGATRLPISRPFFFLEIPIPPARDLGPLKFFVSSLPTAAVALCGTCFDNSPVCPRTLGTQHYTRLKRWTGWWQTCGDLSTWGIRLMSDV